jgi:hypothetical protein
LLDGSAGKKNVTLTCAICGATCKGMLWQRILSFHQNLTTPAQTPPPRLSSRTPNRRRSHQPCAPSDLKSRPSTTTMCRQVLSFSTRAKSVVAKRFATTLSNCAVQTRAQPSSMSASAVTSALRYRQAACNIC